MKLKCQRPCGDCHLCCNLIGVLELGKAPNTDCQHCTSGCAIFASKSRPRSCGDYACLWVGDRSLPDQLRPDHVHAVLDFNKTGTMLQVRVDPSFPQAWKEGPLGEFLKAWVQKNRRVIILTGMKRTIISPGP